MLGNDLARVGRLHIQPAKLLNERINSMDIRYSAYVQDQGWQDEKQNGQEAGTTGHGLRMEAIKMYLQDAPGDVNVTYRAHVQGHGWTDWMLSHQVAGLPGQSLRMEAIEIKLTGNVPTDNLNVIYHAHLEGLGWQPFVENGAQAGTTGQARRLEAIRIALTYEGLLADNGDLDQQKYTAWKSAIREDYYNHHFFKDTIPMAVNPVDDREEGGITERYSTLRNANFMFVKMAADIFAWKADPAGLSSNFFKQLPTPLGATPKLYQDDLWLANFVMKGPDPTTLELATKETKLPFSTFRSYPPGENAHGWLPRNYDNALETGRVFHVDFSKYDAAMSGGRYTSWPHAVFMSSSVRDSSGYDTWQLFPIAISLIPPGQASKKPVTVFPTPSTRNPPPCTWETAKRVFLSAAANYHELGTHLSRCHLVMERYALATYRNLPPWHPVGRLLRPHFKFMVATNNDAVKNLINSGGPIDKNFMAPVDSLLKVTLDTFSSWDLKTHGGIEADLKRRGLLGSDCKLPWWPYKQYGLAIYGAIQNFVRSYLRLWYKSDGAAYGADVALQNWRRALREEYRAGSLMEPNASFEDLVTACTNMIWTCGPQHSAVNYSQYDFLADAKTLPFAIQRAPGAPMFEPSRENIGDQAMVISRLALFRYDQLGVYSAAPFLTEYGDLGDPGRPWKHVVDTFLNELKGLAAHQHRPGEKDVWDYRFLFPEDITNAISI
jgi:arachidonate 15-lipoxygenase